MGVRTPAAMTASGTEFLLAHLRRGALARRRSGADGSPGHRQQAPLGLGAMDANDTAPVGNDQHRLVLERVERLLAEHDPATTPAVEFLGARFDAGLAW